MLSFSEVINSSLEWTATLLFRPFRIKKWLMFTFVALLAGYISGGSNLNFSRHFGNEEGKKETVQTAKAPAKTVKPAPTPKEVWQKAKAELEKPRVRVLLAVIIALLMALFVFFAWLQARFEFVFLENILRNDASLKIPFRQNKPLGNSLFLFNLVFLAISLSITVLLAWRLVATLIKIGLFSSALKAGAWKIFCIILFYGAGLLFWWLACSFVGLLIVKDFLVPLAYRDKITILQAWKKFSLLFGANKKSFFLYWLIKIGLGICCNIIYGILSLLATLALLFPMIILVLLFYLIYQAIPHYLHLTFAILVGSIAVPLALMLIYGLICLGLPFGVFLRTLSLKFLSRISPENDPFRLAVAK